MALSISLRLLALALVIGSPAVEAEEKKCVSNSVVFVSDDPTDSTLSVRANRRINSCTNRYSWADYAPYQTTLHPPYHVSAFAAEEESNIVVQLSFNGTMCGCTVREEYYTNFMLLPVRENRTTCRCHPQQRLLPPVMFRINPDARSFHVYCKFENKKLVCQSITTYDTGVTKCVPTCVTYFGYDQKLHITGQKMNTRCGDFHPMEYDLNPQMSLVCFLIEEHSNVSLQLQLNSSVGGLQAGPTVHRETMDVHAEKGLASIICLQTGRSFVCELQNKLTENVNGMVWSPYLPVAPMQLNMVISCTVVHVAFTIADLYQKNQSGIFQLEFDRFTPPYACVPQNVTRRVAFFTFTSSQASFSVAPGALMTTSLLLSTFSLNCGEFYVDKFDSMHLHCMQVSVGCFCAKL